jgi:serine/threonine protein kinase
MRVCGYLRPSTLLLFASKVRANTPSNSSSGETVVVKGVRHFRIKNEHDVLRRFQDQTPNIRPLIDEIEDPYDPPTIVLKHLDDDLLNASQLRRLTRPGIKYVARNILQALKVLHDDGYVHTGLVHWYFKVLRS